MQKQIQNTDLSSKKITKITRIPYKGKVYNLGVKEHHNYFANGSLVNNCYVSAIKEGLHFDNICEKAQQIWGTLSLNLRPMQLALGGSGEPTMHPDFCQFLHTISGLGIMPNYTTNGMHLTEEIIQATIACGSSVAVSCHPHLERFWRGAAQRYIEAGVKTCFHVIIGEEGSTQKLINLLTEFPGAHKIVALPYQVAGRAKEIEVEEEFKKLFQFIQETQKKDVEQVKTKFAFGALFYDYLLKHDLASAIGISIYEPESLSGYRMLDDSYKLLRRSSYDLRPKFES